MTRLELIHLYEEKIETYATQLRCELEEFAEEMRDLDEEYYTPDGTAMDYDDILELAEVASDIESKFFKE